MISDGVPGRHVLSDEATCFPRFFLTLGSDLTWDSEKVKSIVLPTHMLIKHMSSSRTTDSGGVQFPVCVCECVYMCVCVCERDID